eukprot:Skav212805  [mRNA]  locus=scaffold1633:247997:254974:- [translate_table: standard]
MVLLLYDGHGDWDLETEGLEKALETAPICGQFTLLVDTQETGSLGSVQTALSAQAAQEKEPAVDAWIHNMICKGAKATQWLKGSMPAQPNALRVTQEDGSVRITRDIQDSFKEIEKFWNQIWQRDIECEELLRLRSGNLTRPSGVPMQDDWHLQASELLELAQKNSGAAGPA